MTEHAFDWLDAPVTRVSGKDVPMPYAANLEKLALPSVAEVVGGQGGLLPVRCDEQSISGVEYPAGRERARRF